MKKEILKIAGVKSEKEFYKKFPDEASFMKAHGKEFKKAMRANKVDKAQVGDMIGGGGPSFGAGATNVGPSGGFSFQPSSQFGAGSNIDQSWSKAISKKAAGAGGIGGIGEMGGMGGMGGAGGGTNFAPYIQATQDVIRGIGMIKEQKKKVKRAKQMADLTGVQATAIASTPIQPIKRQYITPWDEVIQPDELFPSGGVGTNPLAQDGAVIGGNPTEIMNTFAPNTIYSDMGYEPLSDSDKVKQFAGGGQLAGMLNDSKFGDIMGQGGGDVLTNVTSSITGEEDAGTAIGGGIGQAVGSIFYGPVGGMIGKFAGSLIGDVVDQSERKVRSSQKQTRKNVASMMGSQFGAGIQNELSANVKNGGIIKAQGGKDLTKKDGKCAAEEARNKEYAAMDKEASRDLRALDKANAAAERIAARQSAQEMADYMSEGLTGYGDKIKKKDFDAAYQAFASQNPELAKDRLLYTLANKEFNKVKRNPEYYMRNVLRKVDPSLDYNAITLPQLMQTMQKGFGSGQGYYDAWKEGFPSRTYTMPQLTPIKQENGGETSDYQWISHTWQPQVITHFGEHKVSDLLRPPADADMLRAGGEIKNLRKNYMSPEEEMMTQMAFGGQLKTTWGGHAEPISQNPYLPGTGQTVMFRGQSHDESDGKGRTGIGVKYGKPDSYTDYAEYGTEADADVEVERNEPAVELPDTKSQLDPSSQFAMGGGVDNENLSMNVFGNLVISELVSPEYAGRKYKSVVEDLSEETTISNKKIEKASEKLADFNPQSAYDMTKFNSLKATIYGENMKLKKIADDIQNLAAGQSAYNDTAEEMGLDADKLAKGKVAMAKRGANVSRAQDGKDVIKKLHDAIGISPDTPGYGTDIGKRTSIAYNNWAKDNLPEEYNETDPSDHFWKFFSPRERAEMFIENYNQDYMQPLRKKLELTTASQQSSSTPTTEDNKKLTKVEALPSVPKGQKKGKVFWGKVTQQDFEDMKARNPWYDWENFNPARAGDTKKFQKEFNKRAKEVGSSVRLREDDAFGEQTASAKSLYDGAMPRGRMQRIDLDKAYKGIPELKPVVPKTTGPATNILKPVTPPEKKDFDIMNALSQALPYLRPSDVEELDPSQLMGEMYALSTNQVEPVWAQKLIPRLSTPIDISLQDILDENRATLRRQQQMLGYNPAAQSAFAAQEYDVNKRVLGEQFRMNQAEKQRVYEKNRDILSQYDLANMGILDKQYERQATALSKTKATTQEALNSIASKIAQNRLENRTLATYENLYNYRYDPAFRALSYQIANMNIPTVGSTQRSDIPSTATPPISGRAKSGSSIKKRKEALNSTVVRSLKSL